MSSNFLSDFILGGCAGIIAKTVAAPLERVKLLLQTQDSNKQLMDKKYRGFFDCGKRIMLEEGVLAYWRGNSANVIRYLPTSALNFGFKDMFGRRYNQYDPVTQKSQFMKWSIITGGMAGTCTTMFIHPLDLARTRMGVDVGKAGQTQFRGLGHCLQFIFRTNGIGGLYNGLGISIPSIFLYRGLYFGFWDIGKSMIPDYKERSLLLKFALAQSVTMSSETLSYPMDTIRRRMMMNSGLEKKIYDNTLQCIRSIITNEGWAAFFKGNFTNMLRGLSSSLVLVLYDEMKKFYLSKK